MSRGKCMNESQKKSIGIFKFIFNSLTFPYVPMSVLVYAVIFNIRNVFLFCSYQSPLYHLAQAYCVWFVVLMWGRENNTITMPTHIIVEALLGIIGAERKTEWKLRKRVLAWIFQIGYLSVNSSSFLITMSEFRKSS